MRKKLGLVMAAILIPFIIFAVNAVWLIIDDAKSDGPSSDYIEVSYDETQTTTYNADTQSITINGAEALDCLTYYYEAKVINGALGIPEGAQPISTSGVKDAGKYYVEVYYGTDLESSTKLTKVFFDVQPKTIYITVFDNSIIYGDELNGAGIEFMDKPGNELLGSDSIGDLNNIEYDFASLVANPSYVYVVKSDNDSILSYEDEIIPLLSNPNYNIMFGESGSDYGDLTINRRPINIKWGTTLEFTYDGTVKHPTAEAYGNFAYNETSSDIGVNYVDSLGNAIAYKNASDTKYTVYANSANNNYYFTGSNLSIDYKINKRELSVDFGEITTPNFAYIYNRTPQYSGPIFKNVVDGEVITPEVEYYKDGVKVTDLIDGKPYRAGTYTVKVVGINASGNASADNYTIDHLSADELQYTYTIKPKTIQLSWDKDSYIYDGDSKQPIPSVVAAYGFVNGDDVDLDESITGGVDALNANTYSATASIVGADKDNYVIYSDASINHAVHEFEIKKQQITIVYDYNNGDHFLFDAYARSYENQYGLYPDIKSITGVTDAGTRNYNVGSFDLSNLAGGNASLDVNYTNASSFNIGISGITNKANANMAGTKLYSNEYYTYNAALTEETLNNYELVSGNTCLVKIKQVEGAVLTTSTLALARTNIAQTFTYNKQHNTISFIFDASYLKGNDTVDMFKIDVELYNSNNSIVNETINAGTYLVNTVAINTQLPKTILFLRFQ